jgi:ubiquinone/menaquinone biosynthesis C-methylase UbiE
MERRAASFDEKAKAWDQNPAMLARNRDVAAAMRRLLPPMSRMRALDYGAGTGLLTMELIGDLAEVVAVDTSSGMLEVLREKIGTRGSITIRNHDLSQAPLREKPFDLIYSSMTLHHVADVGAVLRRFHELVRPGGYVAVSDLEPEDGSFHGSITPFHHAGFDPEELGRELAELGFTDIRHERVHVMSRVVDGREWKFPVFLIVARKR